MEFKCIPCDKTYKSYQSLWNHNRKFHNTIKIDNKPNAPEYTIPAPEYTIPAPECTLAAPECTMNEPVNKNKCKYCNHVFTRTTSLKRHYNICKNKESIESKLKEENELLKQKLKEKEEKDEKRDEDMAMIKQELALLKKDKAKSIKTVNNMNNSHNTTYNIVQFGHENFDKLLSEAEKIHILKQSPNAFMSLVEHGFINEKYPQLMNLRKSNLRDNLAYVRNPKTGILEPMPEDEVYYSVLADNTYYISDFYDTDGNALNNNEKNRIEKEIKKLESNDPKYDAKLMNKIRLCRK